MKTWLYLSLSVILVNAYAVDNEAKTSKKVSSHKQKQSMVPYSRNNVFKSLSPEMEKIAKNAIVIIDGKEGSGTGFVAEFNGKMVIITNLHVIQDNENLKFVTRSGRELKPKDLFFAKDRDLSILELEDKDIVTLKIEPKVEALGNSTQVVVYGNSLGKSIVTEVKGTLQGVGPTEIESDAKFVEGNSGSPIIDMTTGKVIGVATRGTHKVVTWSTYGTKFVTRRFGTRVDNITWDDFQKYDKEKYKYDKYLIHKLKSSVVTARLFLRLFSPYYGRKPDEFASGLREKIKPLHCKLDEDFGNIPELASVYRKWNLKYVDNEDRLKTARRFEARRRRDPTFRYMSSKTDLHILIDFQTYYICLRYTVPRLIADGRKQYMKKPFHYEFFKREGKELLDIENKLLEDYDTMIKNLTIIYKAKK